MKKVLITCYISLFSALSYAQITVVDSIKSGGIYRSYRLYIPAIYNSSVATPLIFNIHGYTSNALEQQNYTNFKPIADTANFLMVFPQGTKDNTGNTWWNAGVNNGLVDDIGFISHLIDSLKLDYNIDLNRIYSTGLSNGGFMSHVLACALNNRIAAIASVSGTFFTYQYPYHPNKAVPVMQIHGTADGTVPYAGASNMVSADTVVNFWVRNNHCAATPVYTAVPNTNTADGCTAENYKYLNGDNGTAVEFYKILGGAHTWPGAIYTIGVTNRDINASKEIWRFFRQYTLNPLSGISEQQQTENTFSIYPNPANQNITIAFFKETSQYTQLEIFTDFGQLILSKEIIGNKTETLDLYEYPKGLYVAKIKYNSIEFSTKKFIVN